MNARSIVVLIGLSLPATLFVPAAYSGDEVSSDSSCQELWVARNQIYKNAGYCFKTARAREFFGNGSCTYDDVSLVPINDADRRYISQIKKFEAQKGC
jgi:YARHG domain